MIFRLNRIMPILTSKVSYNLISKYLIFQATPDEEDQSFQWPLFIAAVGAAVLFFLIGVLVSVCLRNRRESKKVWIKKIKNICDPKYLKIQQKSVKLFWKNLTRSYLRIKLNSFLYYIYRLLLLLTQTSHNNNDLDVVKLPSCHQCMS